MSPQKVRPKRSDNTIAAGRCHAGANQRPHILAAMEDGLRTALEERVAGPESAPKVDKFRIFLLVQRRHQGFERRAAYRVGTRLVRVRYYGGLWVCNRMPVVTTLLVVRRAVVHMCIESVCREPMLLLVCVTVLVSG
jgi:hypothetical protein